MKQPTARVTSKYGEDFGAWKVVSIQWSNLCKEEGEVQSIELKMDNFDLIMLFFRQRNGGFQNATDSLFAEIIDDGI